MKERDKTLLKSWMDGITLGDRKLRPIGAGQAVVLRTLGNAFVTDGKETSPDDMVEIVMVMAMTRDEISGYIEADDDQRNGILGRFAALHIDEIDGVIAQVAESLERLGNSIMESDNMGKEIRHAS
jgi:hypothetical protein